MASTDTQLHINCPNCGSPEVAYSAEEIALHCEFCDYRKELPKGQDEIVERPLGASFSLADAPQGLALEAKVFHCENCGSDTSIPQEQVSFVCPFCGSENVNEIAYDTRVIRPSGVLPFTVPKDESLVKFKNWLGRGWFHPNNLTKLAQVDKIQGVYLPFWTYDAFTQSQWRADAGYYYYVQEKYRGPNGQIQMRTVQKVRWEPARGYYEHFFDDVLVCASHGVSQRMAERVYPYHLNQVVNYDSQYLLGWEAEVYQKNIRDGFQVADQVMDAHIRQACAARIPGDTYRNLRVKTEKDHLTFKHLLLPVWLAGYQYKGKIYQFIVNGQTGKVSGKKPLSAIKVTLAVILGLILIGGIIFAAQYAERGGF